MYGQIAFLVSVFFAFLTLVFLMIGVYVRNKNYGESPPGKITGVRYFLLAALSFGITLLMVLSTEIGFSWNVVGISVFGAIIFSIMLTFGEVLNRVSSRFLVTKDSLSPLEQFIKIFNLITKKSADETDSGVDNKRKN